jgi:mannose-6-phosphate isomerase-like protein (cupin superfamily)
MMEAPANLTNKLGTFTDRFSPRTVATYNDNDIMVAKLEGPFHWHKHDETDDFFLVLKGTLDIELRDRTVTLRAGEVFIVPKGVEHRPVARGEVHILLIEPTGTPNTGDKATSSTTCGATPSSTMPVMVVLLKSVANHVSGKHAWPLARS